MKRFTVYSKIELFISEELSNWDFSDWDGIEDSGEAHAKALSDIRSYAPLCLYMDSKGVGSLYGRQGNYGITIANEVFLGKSVEEAKKVFMWWYTLYGDPDTLEEE